MESVLAAAVTRYNTTWSMRELFLNSGLFEWKPMSFDAEPGDVYLDIDEDDGAGNDCDQVDMIELTIVRC